MPKTRPPYRPQLRARLIELAWSGRTPEELGRQFEPSSLCRMRLRNSSSEKSCPGQ
jgi:hypothetical protein